MKKPSFLPWLNRDRESPLKGQQGGTMNLNHCPRLREHDSEWLENRARGISHCTPNGRENTRVLLTTQNVLLGDVLELLLADELIPVHRIKCTQPDSLWQEVEQHQPQVIVLEEGLFDAVCLARLAQRQGRGRRGASSSFISRKTRCKFTVSGPFL